MIVCDTGALVAAALVNDDHHEACVEMFGAAWDERRTLYVPATVVAEVGFLLEREAGPRVEAMFLRSLADRDFEPVDLTPADFGRAAELVDQYADLPLGTTDATVVAVAERLRVSDLATLDHRDFSVVRPRHVGAFTLLP